ncbi:hypothetical protein PAPYR_3002 [Paratrimastix pyriformis]|uniref:Uncharacterized protein n=1 Tax=Paratrimastix pyriformis TaxID=342808 RepID=A0ABQ8UPL0_9EUKA|nr:hypothetical protein PAPYR_3002 [Paratrimastix pyriformis]
MSDEVFPPLSPFSGSPPEKQPVSEDCPPPQLLEQPSSPSGPAISPPVGTPNDVAEDLTVPPYTSPSTVDAQESKAGPEPLQPQDQPASQVASPIPEVNEERVVKELERVLSEAPVDWREVEKAIEERELITSAVPDLFRRLVAEVDRHKGFAWGQTLVPLGPSSTPISLVAGLVFALWAACINRTDELDEGFLICRAIGRQLVAGGFSYLRQIFGRVHHLPPPLSPHHDTIVPPPSPAVRPFAPLGSKLPPGHPGLPSTPVQPSPLRN